MERAYAWVAAHWVAGAGFMAVGQLGLMPILAHGLSLPLVLIALHSPGYMLHQVEEHSGDRFREFCNHRLFQGLPALTTAGVLWVNLPGVWGINFLALYAAGRWGGGAGLAAPYLTAVNAVSHIGMGLRMRCYNPGLVTSLVLFLPLSLVTLFAVPASFAQHALGFAVSLAVHLAIIVGIAGRAARLRHRIAV